MENQLVLHWKTLLSTFEIDQNQVISLFEEIASKYNEPHRQYHNFNHIKSMLELSTVFEFSEELQLAIWFHDIIYNPLRSNNESKSADFASIKLLELGESNNSIQEVRRLIQLTKTHKTSPNDILGKQLLDLDLAILGSNPETYFNYMQSIRKEYHIYPDLVYKPGRIKVLKSFLNREALFQTKELKHLELQAIENITNELNPLVG
jgi:predicted metal-dependent HD superfamily phosphohydrolase